MSERKVHRRADNEASLWYARHERGLTPDEERSFEAWRRSDPEREQAWSDYAALLEPIEPSVSRRMSSLLGERAARRRRRRLGVTAGVAVAALMLVLTLPRSTEQPREAVVARASLAVSAPATLALPDGSTVELDRGAELTHEFSEEIRQVRLVSGTAYFSVVPDPSRPFVVSTPKIDVRAVGTAFSVGVVPGEVEVLVTHGRIAVERHAEDAAVESEDAGVFADAGDRVRISVANTGEPIRVERLPLADINQQLAWRDPRLDLSATPLAEVVTALNAASGIQLQVGDRATGELRLTGVFRADNAEGFVRMLEANYGIAAERNGDTIVLRSRRR